MKTLRLLALLLAAFSGAVQATPAFVSAITQGGGSVPYLFGNGPITSDSFTPTIAGNVMLVAGLDLAGASKTMVATGTGVYSVISPPGAQTDLNTITNTPFNNLSLTTAAQTLTVDSSPTGDYLNVYGLQFSGVGCVTATWNTAGSVASGTGNIVGNAVFVPTGSVLVALFIESTHTGATPVVNLGTQFYTDYYLTLGVLYAGAGGMITPNATPSVAGKNYSIFEWLLSPGTCGTSGGGGNMFLTFP